MKKNKSTGYLTPTEKFGYGLGDFASNLVFQPILFLLPVFYTDVFGLGPAAMGTMFLAIRLMDTVTDPIMGVIADRTDTRWGKYRPYLLFLAIPYAVLFVATFITPELGYDGKLVYAYLTYAGLMLIYTMINIPYCALGGVLTRDTQERVSANSYRYFMSSGAGVIVTLLGPKLVEFFGRGQESHGYPFAMVFFGALAVAAFFGCFALTKERISQSKNIKASLGTQLKALFRNDQWIIVSILFFVLLIPTVLRYGSAAYYIKWFVGRPDLTAAFLTMGTVAAMIGCGLAASVVRKFDKVPTYVMLQVVAIICSLALYRLPYNSLTAIFVLHMATNFFVQMGAPILWTMAADTVEYGEFKTGIRTNGLVFSGALFFLKLGVAVGGWLIGIILAIHGYDGQASVQTEEAIKGIVLSLTLIPAAWHLLLIPCVLFYKLNRSKCEEIKISLESGNILE